MENSSFYEAELRSGYPVDGKLKKIWSVELDLLERMIEICDQYDIPYFAIGGTLLGAVRHQGFIPWDDDIDIGMLRKDYDRFLCAAKKELKPPYFLQTTQSDKQCYRAHAQIRNSNTTGYMRIDEQLDCNKGIFIDIFPLDGVIDNPILYKLQMFELKVMNRMFMNYFYFDVVHENPPVLLKSFHGLVTLFFNIIGHKTVYDWYDKCASRYSKRNTRKVGELTILFDNERYQWRRSYFRKSVKLPFEHLMISAPVEYDFFLKNTFGNYMEYPEHKETGALHGDMIFDPDRPY